MNRRDLFKAGVTGLLGGVAASQTAPLGDFLRIVYSNLERKAFANSATQTLNYVVCVMPGAPPRWIFDHFVKTSPQDAEMVLNPMVATRYNARGRNVEYVTYDYNGVLVPHIWSTSVSTATGGQMKMEELLRHMIVVRGYGTGFDSHTTNCTMQTAPVPSLGSVHGYVADHSTTPLKVVQYPLTGLSALGAFSGYQSVMGTGLTSLPEVAVSANLLEELLFPFNGHNAAGLALKQRYRGLAPDIQKYFADNLKERVADSAPILNDFQSAQDTILEGVDGLTALWAPLFNKYYDLIQTTAKASGVPGFTDKAITAPNVPNLSTEHPFGLFTSSGDTLFPTQGFDLRDFLKSIDMYRMAQNFALAEFCLVHDYANSLELSFGPYIENVTGHFSTSTSGTLPPGEYPVYVFHDQHFTGKMAGLMVNAAFFRAYSAGLLELVNQLKQADLFKKTLIHTASDFGRTPRVSGGGSDHGFDAMITSFVTGLHDGPPMVLGNILRDGTGLGTFGQKAPTTVQTSSGSSDVLLSPTHVASTLAVLLNLPENKWSNLASPLVALQDGNVIPLASAKVVT